MYQATWDENRVPAMNTQLRLTSLAPLWGKI
jgi:hypothetical protein